MSAKNKNHYPLNLFSSFSKDKFYQDNNMNNYMINKKGMFTPKKFDLLAFGFLFFYSVPLILVISGVSFFLVVPFSQNVESANETTLMIMKYLAIIVFVISAYLSFVVNTDNSNKYYHNGLLSIPVKKKNTAYFGQQEYDLVKKHCPSELDKWVSAIIEYGENRTNEAKTYANTIAKTAQQKENALRPSGDKVVIASEVLWSFVN